MIKQTVQHIKFKHASSLSVIFIGALLCIFFLRNLTSSSRFICNGLSIISGHIPHNSSEVKICYHVILSCSHAGHVRR